MRGAIILGFFLTISTFVYSYYTNLTHRLQIYRDGTKSGVFIVDRDTFYVYYCDETSCKKIHTLQRAKNFQIKNLIKKETQKETQYESDDEQSYGDDDETSMEKKPKSTKALPQKYYREPNHHHVNTPSTHQHENEPVVIVTAKNQNDDQDSSNVKKTTSSTKNMAQPHKKNPPELAKDYPGQAMVDAADHHEEQLESTDEN
jgi:hypothetical protein